MSAIAWWGIPVGATLLAILWVSWASRPKPRIGVHESLQQHERFRRALERSAEADERRRDDRAS